jgi:hypothetical protein
MEYCEQFDCMCLVLDKTEDADEVIETAKCEGAIYFDGEKELLCVKFPGRPQELYSETAIRRSLSSNAELRRAYFGANINSDA